MELARYAVAAGFFGAASYGFFSFTAVPEAIRVTDARLYPRGEALLLEAQIENPGRPDRLLGLGSEAAARSLLTGLNLVVPGAREAALDLGSVHGMLIGAHGKVYQGRQIPVTLWFESWGPVRIKAEITGAAHGQHDVEELPQGAPSEISLSIEEREDGLWASAVLPQLDGIAAAVAPTANLYLNGLLLGPLDGAEAPLGQLPPGPHLVSVILHSTTGSRYATSGEVIEVSSSIVVE